MTHAEKTIARLLNDGNAIVRSTVEQDGIAYYVVDDLVEQKTIHIPVSGITLYFLTADTTNGVQVGNEEDAISGDPLSQDDFFEALKDLADDKCIGSYVTYQMREKVEEIYGICS